MKAILTIFFFLISLSIVNKLYAQKPQGKLITGIVINAENNQPLEGASVSLKSNKDATGTMADGSFSLEVPEGDTIIVVTAEGFEQQEIKLGTIRDITISLKLKSSALSEVYIYTIKEQVLLNSILPPWKVWITPIPGSMNAASMPGIYNAC
ncbi:MAG: carboxypeptidase-like regulatory domain-containing protein [Agriterribacter sp.]